MKLINIPFFSNSVRCFFPAASLLAVLVPMYTIGVIVNGYPFVNQTFSLFEWHAYQMLFGFVTTLIIGFILTAGGHWAGKGTLSGMPLVILFILWILEQLTLLLPMSSVIPFIFAVSLSSYFIYTLNNLLSGYKQQLRFVLLLATLSLCKLAYLAALAFNFGQGIEDFNQYILNITMWVLIVLTTIVGGRVTPRFTRNYFKIAYPLDSNTKLEKFSFYANLSIILTCFNFLPDVLNSIVFIIAGIANLTRMIPWQSSRALRKPIIGMLHIGYFTIAISLIFIGLSYVFEQLTYANASLHFLLAGGISIMGINIMIRASLGHTGHKVEMTPAIYVIFASIIIGAYLRMFIPVLLPELTLTSYHYSMGFWTFAFLIYLIKFIPIVLKKRADA